MAALFYKIEECIRAGRETQTNSMNDWMHTSNNEVYRYLAKRQTVQILLSRESAALDV